MGSTGLRRRNHGLYVLTGVWGLMMLSHRPFDRKVQRAFGTLVLPGAFGGLLQLNVVHGRAYPDAGGLAGTFLADQLYGRFGYIGSNVIAGIILIMGVLLTTDFLVVYAVLAAQRFMAQLIRTNVTAYESLRRGCGGNSSS